MSRSRKKPVTGSLFRHWIACVDDVTPKSWKQVYNRNIRRTNKQKTGLIVKLNIDDVDDDETQFIDKPALTSDGNEYNSPGDGKTLFDANSGYRKPHWWSMK